MGAAQGHSPDPLFLAPPQWTLKSLLRTWDPLFSWWDVGVDAQTKPQWHLLPSQGRWSPGTAGSQFTRPNVLPLTMVPACKINNKI